MADRELVLLRLPEFFERVAEKEDVLAACGPTIDEFETMRDQMEAMAAGEEPEAEDEEEEFESVSFDPMTEVSAYLLGVAADDPDAYGNEFRALVTAMTEEGTMPLIDIVAARSSESEAQQLLAGLNAEAARRAACAWAANVEYEAPAEPASGGWYGDFLELKYRPRGHADPVVRAWIEFAAAAVGKAEDEDEADRARELRDSLLSPKDGAGACIKCHAVTAAPAEGETVEDTERVRIEWTYGEHVPDQPKPVVRCYSLSDSPNPCLSGLHPHPLGLEWAQTGYRGARHGCSRPRRSPIPAFATRVPATFPR